MVFKSFKNLSFLFSLLVVLILASSTQAGNAMATHHTNLQAVVNEVANSDHSQCIWRNRWDNAFISNRGVISSRFISYLNPDDQGGRSCMLADDFVVGTDSIWSIDSLSASMYWHGKAPDRIQVLIRQDFWGLPNDDILYDFTFDAVLPDELTLYNLKVAVKKQDIILEAGTYWISFMGVYDTSDFEDGFLLWNRKDTLIGPSSMVCLDSIGAHYTFYPTGWKSIWFNGEKPDNSAKFSIKAAVQRKEPTDIYMSSLKNAQTLVSVYPNPASDHLLFQLNKAGVTRIEIYNFKGRLVKAVSVKAKSCLVDIKSVSNGIYFYNLINRSGKITGRGDISITK